MINADEIAGIIKQRIAGFKTGADQSEVGTVIEVGDNIAIAIHSSIRGLSQPRTGRRVIGATRHRR